MIVRGTHPAGAPPVEPTIHRQLLTTVRRHGDRTAFSGAGYEVSWREAYERSAALARALLARGVAPGDRVAVWMPNSVEWVVVWLAAIQVRAVFVPVSTRLTVEEFRHVLADCAPTVLFADPEPFALDSTAYLGDGREGMSTVMLTGSANGAARSYADFLASGDAVDPIDLQQSVATIDRDDPVLIVYTSGSTGGAKGVVHDHRILRNEAAIAWYLGITAESRVLGHMPFFHVAGGLSAVLPALITGAEVVLMPMWDVATALDLIARRGVTVFGGIATHYVDVLTRSAEDAAAVATLRSGWIGGSMNPSEVMRAATARLGFRPLPAYGMTETTSVTTYPLPDDPDDIVYAGRGRPISDFELRVVGPDGRTLGPGVPGEVSVRGHLVMRGYFGRPDATAAVIDADGWFQTGDVGVLDADGYLSITGRLKEMYVVGGSNVFPSEVETALSKHPAVVQAHVVAVPDERLGEVGYAYVEASRPDVTGDDLRRHAAERLSGYKVPRYVEFVRDWPTNGTGKIDKIALRRRATSALGLDDVAAVRLLPADLPAGGGPA
jgi:fatty-acyl-CoA synthase